jgi:hypothetical protein
VKTAKRVEPGADIAKPKLSLRWSVIGVVWFVNDGVDMVYGYNFELKATVEPVIALTS